MYLPAIVLVFLSILQLFSCYEELNTDGNVIFEYLGIDPKSVSKHKLTTVNVARTHKRDLQQGTAVTFQAIDEEISLWLRPLDSMLASDTTPVYYAYYGSGYPGKVYFQLVPNAMKDVRTLLEDPKHYATVVLRTDDSGKITVNGHLRSPGNGAHLVINSLPKHIVKGSLADKKTLNDLIDDPNDFSYHVIVELNDFDNLQKINLKDVHGNERELTSSNNAIADTANPSNSESPDTLYPQMLIQLDNSFHTKRSQKSLSSILEYTLALCNGIDLIYRQMKNPKIKFNIAAIIISADRQGTPYLNDNLIVERVSYDIDKALPASRLFFYAIEGKSPIPAFDAAVVFTKMHGIRQPQPENEIPDETVTDIDHICKRDDGTQQNYAVALTYDNGAYAGIFTAAHQIGHLLGALHEDDSTHTDCTKEGKGSLMDSSPTFSSGRTRLSSCAIEDIRTQFTNGKLDCLYNVPQMTGTKLPGLMPGLTSNIIKECNNLGFGLPCYPKGAYADICSRMWCTSANDTGKCEDTKNAAPPGLTCLMNNFKEYGVCLGSRCVTV